jgi:outer membrane protein
VSIALAIGHAPVHAQSLNEALGHAYVNNPQLNAARAQLRVTNENVPQALAGYRPRVTANASIGHQWSGSVDARGNESNAHRNPSSVNLQVDQTLFNGFQTDNAVRQAESLVRAQRETLRTVEQDVFLAAITAYMDVVRDTATLEQQRIFVNVINEQLRSTRDRFAVGEVTRTDVAQAEASLASARSQLTLAQANLNVSRATFRRVVGRDPGRLNGRVNAERLIPRSLAQAVDLGSRDHPQVRAAVYGVDAATFAISVAEAALLPTVTVSGTAQRSISPSTQVDRTDSLSIVGRVTVPIYDGGVAPSRVRQARETLGQRRIEVDTVRDQIRALVTSNWGTLEAQRQQIVAAQASINATQIALAGVREEARVGQRTTLDVLNAEQAALNARVTLVRAERDRVVAAYSLIGAMGRLNVASLGVPAPRYDAEQHYRQVRDRWHGLRTPGGE